MIRKLLSILLLSAVLFTFLQPTVLAIDPYKDVCQAGSDQTVCTTQNINPVTGQDSIIPKIANIAAAIGGVIAVVIIMMSGLTLITSTGDSAKITQARNSVIYACVGIVVIIAARVIVGFIMRYL